MISAQIIECFEVTGRGTIILIDSKTDLPTGRCLRAKVQHHDGSTREYEAWKEWLLRRTTPPLEDEAFLIVDAVSEKVSIGGTITLKLDES